MDVNFDDLGLTKKQAIFVKVYVSERNGTKAAIAAGFSQKAAAAQASRLLKQDNIKTALARISNAVAARVKEPEAIKDNLNQAVNTAVDIAITAETIMLELAQMGMTQRLLRKFLTQQDGHLVYDFSTATEEELQSISPQIAEVNFECETTTKPGKGEGESPRTVKTVRSKVKWHDRKAILELMGRYKEIMAWKDTVEVDTSADLKALLLAGRKRAESFKRPELPA